MKCAAVAAAAAAAALAVHGAEMEVRLPRSTAAAEALGALGVPVSERAVTGEEEADDGAAGAWLHALVTETEHAALQARGVDFDVIEEDVAAFFQRRMAAQADAVAAAMAPGERAREALRARGGRAQRPAARPTRRRADGEENETGDGDVGDEFDLAGSMGGFQTYTAAVAWMQLLHEAYEDVVDAPVVLGCSLEGRAVSGLRVSLLPKLPPCDEASECDPYRVEAYTDETTSFDPSKEACNGGDDSAFDMDAFMLAHGLTVDDVNDNESNVGDPGRHRVVYTALHHAREPGTLHGLFFFIRQLLRDLDAGSAEARHLLSTREIWILPFVNPDGYVHNERQSANGGGMTRKNRRLTCDETRSDSSSNGVDLNRNYAFKWAHDDEGSSGSPCASTYRGESPFSEPETVALSVFARVMHPRFWFNHHTHGGLLMYPYGYDVNVFPDTDEDYAMFKEFTDEMTRFNEYKTGTGWNVDGLYTTNGEADDYNYGQLHINSFTSELGALRSDSFWPVQSRIEPISREAYHMSHYLLQMSAAAYVFEDVAVRDGGDGFFHVTGSLRNLGVMASDESVVLTTAVQDSDSIIVFDNEDAMDLGRISSRATKTFTVRLVLVDAIAELGFSLALGARYSSDEGAYAETTTVSGSIDGCPSPCTASNTFCNLLTGSCSCEAGWTGVDCNVRKADTSSIVDDDDATSAAGALSFAPALALAALLVALTLHAQ